MSCGETSSNVKFLVGTEKKGKKIEFKDPESSPCFATKYETLVMSCIFSET